MSMLAEKKRREKWCLNPRGKSWCDDQSKFGQKLLEKMGWTAGQGLGVNNQGPTEIVKVKKKDDNKGLGFKENGEEWLKTTSEFNELLDQLDSSMVENGDVKTVSSLEDRSKKSKARVHYHKFTRGKDLSRYSEKDLASIIGPDVVKPSGTKKSDTNYSSNQVNKGSSVDYFNEKKQSRSNETAEEVKTADLEREGGKTYKKCKKKKKSKDYEELVNIEQEIEKDKVAKKKSKKDHSSCFEENENPDESYSNDLPEDVKRKSKTKKRKHFENEITLGEENNERTTEQLAENNENGDNNHKVSKKKKLGDENEIFLGQTCEVEPGLDGNGKVNKKKRNKSSVENVFLDSSAINGQIETPLLNDNAIEVNGGNHCNLNNEHLSTKKKEKKLSDKTHNTPNTDMGDSEILHLNGEFPVKTTKNKKKKKQVQVEDVDILHTEINTDLVEDIIENSGASEKISKKKKRKFNDVNENSIEENNQKELKDEIEVCSKKRKIKYDRESRTEHSDVLPCARAEEKSEDQIVETQKSKKKSKTSKEEFVKEEIQNEPIKSEQTNLPKESEDCIEVLGRRTRLKKIGLPLNKKKHQSYETNDYMGFSSTNPGKHDLTYQQTIVKSNPNYKNNSAENKTPEFIKVSGEPNENDCKIIKHVISFEYRQLTAKLKQLKFRAPEIKVVIRNSNNLSQATHRKLKILHKSKHLKTLLPVKDLAEVEASVKKFAEALQPKVDLINAVVEMENKTVQLAEALVEDSSLAKSSGGMNTVEVNKPAELSKGLDTDKVQALKNMSNQLQSLLGKKKSSFEEPFTHAKKNSKIKKDVNFVESDKGITHVSSHKREAETEDLSHEEVTERKNALQTRIEERLKMLAEQMKMLVDGKRPTITPQPVFNRGRSRAKIQGNFNRFPTKQAEGGNFNQNFNSARGRYHGNRRSGFNMRGSFYSRVDTPSVPTESGGKAMAFIGDQGTIPFRGWDDFKFRGSYDRGRGHFSYFANRSRGRRGDFRGQWRADLRGRGRISQNNFDAKKYAEKCKALKITPVLGFKGVDLKSISGYAAGLSVNNTNIESPRPASESPIKGKLTKFDDEKKESSLLEMKKSSVILDVITSKKEG